MITDTVLNPPPNEQDIEEAFEQFLCRQSWPDINHQVHDQQYSAWYDEQPVDHPRRQVLLLSNDGKVVLGYHNENNDQVWAQSGRGKDGGSDRRRDSWSLHDIVVGELPGCIEYLESLLQENGTCGHTPLICRDLNPYSEIPARLCFFSQWTDPDRGVNDDIFYIDTNNLCEACYHKAVPRGFNVWSTSYFDRYNQQNDQDYRKYFRECFLGKRAPRTFDPESGSFLRLYWPRCYSASSRVLAFGADYPRIPGATVAHECWRWLVWNRAPFYIDQLCVSPPYTVYEDPVKKQEENQRISKLNVSAYLGAAHGILGIPPGGRGEWTMVELRILGQRVVPLPAEFGDPNALVKIGPGYMVHGDTYWAPPELKFSGRLKRDPDHSQIALRQAIQDPKMAPSERLPDEKKVLDELIVQIGKPLGPTAAEVERIRRFPNRNYSETVRKYEELLSHLKDRMRETTTPVDKKPHSSISQRAYSNRLERNVDFLDDELVGYLHHSADNRLLSEQSTSSVQLSDRPKLYRRFSLADQEEDDHYPGDRRGNNGRLDRLFCHDSSPYVFCSPVHLVEDREEVDKWISDIRSMRMDQWTASSRGENTV